jgi:hypothetical protein
MGSSVSKRDLQRGLAAAGVGNVAHLMELDEISHLSKRQAQTIKVSVQGNQRVDIKNNILFQNVKHLSFQFPGMQPINLDVDDTTLLYYDLAKNYTWDKKQCTCETIEGPSGMPLFEVPPFATLSAKGKVITVNGVAVTTDEYHANFDFGYLDPYNGAEASQESLMDMDFYLYVDSTNNMRRSFFNFTMMFVLSISTSIDFWSNQPLADNELILPDTLCKDKCKVAVPAVEVYPACVTPDQQCKCPENPLSFCSGTNYPISTLIFTNATDGFVDATYNQILSVMAEIGTVPPDCVKSLKEFLCKFFFSYCNSSANMQKPDLDKVFQCGSLKRSGAASSQRDAAINSNGAFSAYQAAAGKTHQYENSSSTPHHALEGWVIALIVVGSVVLVAAVIGVVAFVIVRNRRGYQQIKG